MSQRHDMSSHFILSICFIGLIGLYVFYSAYSNITTRENNQINLSIAKSCTELQVYYDNALHFEYEFSSNGENIEKVQTIFHNKVKELNCS